MPSVKASLCVCQPPSNVNAFVCSQMTDFIHFWFPLEICCTHSNAWCQEDIENWKCNGQINVTQLIAEVYSFVWGFFVCFFNPQHSPLARNPLTVHPCHYQKQQIINNRPLNLFCSKQYLIEVWTGCDGHKSMVWFLTFPQPKHQLPYQHISDLKKYKNKRSHKCASRLIFFFYFQLINSLCGE